MLPQNDGNQSWYNLLNGTYKYYASEMQNGTGNITGGDTLKAIDNNQDSSRALRSLPLSVMMSGYIPWDSGALNGRGVNSFFWSSTPYAYTHSHHLYFYSTNVHPKNGHYKPSGLALRCVARNPQKPHPYFTSINFRNFPPRSKFFRLTFLKPSAAPSLFRHFFFQSSPQPPSFGYDDGLSHLGQW